MQDGLARQIVGALIERNRLAEESNHIEKKILEQITKIADLLNNEFNETLPTSLKVVIGETMNAKTHSVDLVLNENGTATGTVTPEDVNGNATTLPSTASTPAWTASDPSITIAPDPTGLTAVITAGNVAVPSATVTVTCTLTAGGTLITGTSDPFSIVPAPPGAPTQFVVSIASVSKK